jgi:hypothetical protein
VAELGGERARASRVETGLREGVPVVWEPEVGARMETPIRDHDRPLPRLSVRECGPDRVEAQENRMNDDPLPLTISILAIYSPTIRILAVE